MATDVLERVPSRQSSVVMERRGSLTDVVAELIKNSQEKMSTAIGTMSKSDSEEQAKQIAQIVELAERFQQGGLADQLVDLVKNIRPFLKKISKAKAAKLIKVLIDMYLEIAPNNLGIALCKELERFLKSRFCIFFKHSLF